MKALKLQEPIKNFIEICFLKVFYYINDGTLRTTHSLYLLFFYLSINNLCINIFHFKKSNFLIGFFVKKKYKNPLILVKILVLQYRNKVKLI